VGGRRVLPVGGAREPRDLRPRRRRDGFASGLAYAFLEGKGPQAAVDYGTAHGAAGDDDSRDTSMVRTAEVEAVMKSKGARVVR